MMCGGGSVYDCDPVVPYLLEMINEHLQAGTDWLWNVIRSGERRVAGGLGGWASHNRTMG